MKSDKMCILFFFFNDTATTEIYTTHNTLSLHDALPISRRHCGHKGRRADDQHRAGVRSEEHTSELQSLCVISYAVFCLKKKKTKRHSNNGALYSIKNTELKKKKRN